MQHLIEAEKHCDPSNCIAHVLDCKHASKLSLDAWIAGRCVRIVMKVGLPDCEVTQHEESVELNRGVITPTTPFEIGEDFDLDLMEIANCDQPLTHDPYQVLDHEMDEMEQIKPLIVLTAS